MINRYTLNPLAANDLNEIYDYIASNNLPSAGRWLNQCTELFRKLATAPGLGRNRPELGQGIKSFPMGNYVIFYRVVETDVQILRVLHGARDLKKIFTQTSD